jgi:hypothetical protein
MWQKIPFQQILPVTERYFKCYIAIFPVWTIHTVVHAIPYAASISCRMLPIACR